MNILLMLQEGAEHAAEHSNAQGGHGETPALVTAINSAIGPATVPVQRAIMEPIYGLFGAHWTPPAHGEEIPAHVIYMVIAFVVCTYWNSGAARTCTTGTRSPAPRRHSQ